MRVLAALALLVAVTPAALAEIWECIDENGGRRFTNIRSEAKGCRLLDVGIPNTVPSPKAPTKKAAVPSPEGFPRIDAETQRRRDAERRRILEQELATEERLLAQARQELAEQEAMRLGTERSYQRVLERLEPYRRKVRLHESNITSLRRELANMR